MNIITQRLVLRELEKIDTEEIFQLACDPEVIKYLRYIRFSTYENAEKWVEEKIFYNEQDPRTSYNFAITLKDTGEFIGWIGIGESDDPSKGDLDFGYALKREFWGKGYTSEALHEIVRIGFETMHAKKIYGECDIRNEASKRVMEKAGMKVESTFMDGEQPSVRYSISA